jgi:hypothetical protein
MKHAVILVPVASCALLLGLALGPALSPADRAGAAAPRREEADLKKQVADLRAELKRVEGLAPDQAAVMSHLGYHWSNLWFALEQEHWTLADFYLSEVRSNLKWAVRVKPERVVDKQKVDLKSIAESFDNGQLTPMKAAVAKKDKKKCVELYDDSLSVCYSCHKASDKPYLRPRRPEAPEARVINFDPKAKKPE